MEEPAAEKAEDHGDTHLSSIEAMMLMEWVIEEGKVEEQDHKVRIQLMEAAIENQK